MSVSISSPVATIFGGTGFLGRSIVSRCAKAGWTVRVATRRAAKAGGCRQFYGVGQIVPFEIDYDDDVSIRRAVDGADFVVNTIGILYERGTSNYQRLHVELAERIAKQAGQSGVKSLVHISALGCESGQSKYARSKMAGEKSVRDAYPQAVILRPSLIFGPGDGFFNAMAGMMRFAPLMPLIGGGRTKFQPVYVEDIAKAVFETLRSDEARGQTYELAGSQTYTFEDLLILVRTITQRSTGFVRVPFWYAKLKAFFLGLMPKPLLTMDQVDTLKADSVASGSAPGLHALGIAPVPLEEVMPLYLSRYISGGPEYA